MAKKPIALTFIQKHPTTCPACGEEFFREDMLTGRGRMIAGELTAELRRLYEPSKKYGEIHPLIYPVTVCPHCLYASWKEDFPKLPEQEKAGVQNNADNRREWIENVIDDPVDFTKNRTLNEGLASYILCMSCYDYLDAELSPIIKQGISSLRGAWVAVDLHRKNPTANYDWVAKMLYRKARFFYLTAIAYESSGEQSVVGCPNAGPDLDQNYMFDGILYMYGYLEFRYGAVKDPAAREKNLQHARQTIARIFGMGKASKHKPQALLNNARNLHGEISTVLGIKKTGAYTDLDPGAYKVPGA
ncbi:MAG: DUF2225 domain-containing protein [Salinispira sp.]